MVLLRYLPAAFAYGMLQVLLRFKDDSELAATAESSRSARDGGVCTSVTAAWLTP